MNKVLNKNFWLIGFFSTLAALMINIGGSEFAITNIFLMTAIILGLLNRKVYLNLSRCLGIIFFLLMFFSSLMTKYTLPDIWSQNSIVVSIKYIFFLVPFFVLFSNEELIIYRKSFFKGLLVSCFIQLIWMFAQIVLWTFFNISLNEIVFGQILNLATTHTWTFISDGRFRPAGISWEPANLALSLVIGFILCKNKYIRILFFLGIFLSTSRTGIVCALFCIFVYFLKYTNFFSNKTQIKLKKKDLMLILTLIIALIIIIFSLFFSSQLNIEKLFEGIFDNLTVTFDKFQNISMDSSAATHSLYYSKLLFIMSNLNIFQIVFGIGTACAGYLYSYYMQLYTYIPYWNPETDFITILLGNGVLGFVLYYLIIFKSLKYNNNNKKAYMIQMSILFSGIFYLYYRSTWPLFIIMMLFIKNPKNECII